MKRSKETPPQKPLPQIPVIKAITKPYVWTCKLCDQTFKRQNTYLNHKQRQVPCNYKCRLCELQLHDRKQYLAHVRDHDKYEAKLEEIQKSLKSLNLFEIDFDKMFV